MPERYNVMTDDSIKGLREEIVIELANHLWETNHFTAKSGFSDTRKEAEGMVDRLIHKAVIEGKIDELQRLLLTAGVNIEVNDYGEKRIAALKNNRGGKDE